MRVLVGLPLILLAACAEQRGGNIPYNVQLGLPDPPVAATTDYKIAPTDQLAITVYKSQDLTGAYQVDLAGNISLPLIGEVGAAGLSTAELDRKLTFLLGEKYFQNPEVSVGITASSARSVTVDGAVNKSGSFPVNGTITLIQAIAIAKGPSEDANTSRVAVFRTIQGQRKAAAFDLKAIRQAKAPDPQIYPGDIVVVDGSAIKTLQKRLLAAIPIIGTFVPLSPR